MVIGVLQQRRDLGYQDVGSWTYGLVAEEESEEKEIFEEQVPVRSISEEWDSIPLSVGIFEYCPIKAWTHLSARVSSKLLRLSIYLVHYNCT